MGEQATETRAYSAFRLLQWIQEHTDGAAATPDGKTHEKLEGALAAIRGEYPHFRDSEHPDFLMHGGGAAEVVLPVLPVSVEALADWIESDTARVFGLLSSASDASPGSDFWHNARQLFKELVLADADAALTLLEVLTGRGSDVVSADRGFLAVEAVLEGLGQAELDQMQFERFHAWVGRLPDTLSTGRLQRAADLSAAVIRKQVYDADSGLEGGFLQMMRRAAADLWDIVVSHPVGPTATDAILQPVWNPLMDAINHAAGMLTEFWVKSVEVERSHASSAGSGISEDARSRLEEMLRGPQEASSLVEAILVTRLQFLGYADLEWTVEHVLPLLDFETAAISDSDQPADWEPRHERVWRCWSAYLAWGKTTNELLEAGLDKMYLDIARRMWGERPRQQQGSPEMFLDGRLRMQDYADSLRSHLAAVCVYSDQPIREPGWILELTAALSGEARVWFIRVIGDTLSELDDAAIEETWGCWLERYWQHRLEGIPDHFSRAEAAAFAELVPYSGPHACDAVSMSLKTPAGLLADSQPLCRLAESELVDEIPNEIARLLPHLCTHTEPETITEDRFFTGYALENLSPGSEGAPTVNSSKALSTRQWHLAANKPTHGYPTQPTPEASPTASEVSAAPPSLPAWAALMFVPGLDPHRPRLFQ